MLRVVDYRLPNVPGAELLYRLITTIPDPGQAPARLSFLHAMRVLQRCLARYAAIAPSAQENPA